MTLSIITDNGYDFASATALDDDITMTQLPTDVLDRLQSSPFPDVIILGGGMTFWRMMRRDDWSSGIVAMTPSTVMLVTIQSQVDEMMTR